MNRNSNAPIRPRHRVILPVILCALGLMHVTALTADQQTPAGETAAAPSGTAQPVQPQQPQQPQEQGASDDGGWAPWTGGRYRITPGDVIEVRFPFVPELNQTLSVQPDGYATLREVGDMRLQGQTVPQLRAALREAYEPIVRDLVFTVVLTEFEKPYFVAAGEITRPGRYELRGATTLTQALAYAGGATFKGRTSEVVIFRTHTEATVSVRQVDVKAMYEKRDLSEDPLLQPGDTIYLPMNKLGKLSPVLSRLSLGMFFNPLDLVR